MGVILMSNEELSTLATGLVGKEHAPRLAASLHSINLDALNAGYHDIESEFVFVPGVPESLEAFEKSYSCFVYQVDTIAGDAFLDALDSIYSEAICRNMLSVVDHVETLLEDRKNGVHKPFSSLPVGMA